MPQCQNNRSAKCQNARLALQLVPLQADAITFLRPYAYTTSYHITNESIKESKSFSARRCTVPKFSVTINNDKAKISDHNQQIGILNGDFTTVETLLVN